MIKKVNGAWELAQNLGSKGVRKRHVGTRYHYNDTWGELIRRGVVKPRIHTATDDGTVNGEPVFLTKDELVEKRREQGPYTFSCQQLQNPIADDTQGFQPGWMRYYEKNTSGEGMNKYILIDPANAKKKSSDYTCMWVVGLAADGNRYVLDIQRDRLNLTERTDLLLRLHRKYRPLAVGYEQYGMQADIQHIKTEMGKQNYHFDITELGGSLSKVDRIKRLIPSFEQGKWWFMPTCYRTDYEGKTWDLVSIFIEEELKPFPVAVHDDMFDALARIEDEALCVCYPRGYDEPVKKDRYAMGSKKSRNGWMAR
jgi:predicted phage terminase large subunit-like protein